MFKQILFNRAMASKGREIDQYVLYSIHYTTISTSITTNMFYVFRGIVRQNSIWDWLIFKKIQDGLGGRVRMVLTGSAPISKEVWLFTLYVSL